MAAAESGAAQTITATAMAAMRCAWRAPNATMQVGEDRLMELEAIARASHALCRSVGRIAPEP
jgi:hypothetical protein